MSKIVLITKFALLHAFFGGISQEWRVVRNIGFRFLIVLNPGLIALFPSIALPIVLADLAIVILLMFAFGLFMYRDGFEIYPQRFKVWGLNVTSIYYASEKSKKERGLYKLGVFYDAHMDISEFVSVRKMMFVLRTKHF